MLGADSVYMLLHPGWKNEQRANRWHFAARWARYLPVVLVIPDTMRTGQVTEIEPRIDGARILHVTPNSGSLPGVLAGIQFRQIQTDMKHAGFKRPILWLYNANFAEAFASLPAAKRVHHVTENYFDFPAMAPDYLRRIQAVTRAADLNIAVSKGCADPLRSFADPDRLLIVTNGCDFKFYNEGEEQDRKIALLHRKFERISVFAGNINNRLDIALIERLAATYPKVLFLLVGPIELNAGRFLRLQSSARRFHNIRIEQAVPVEKLPSIYRSADIGIIPYIQERLITENGFPLKVLEMAATGLPVVTSFMRPILSLDPPIRVTQSSDEFVAAIADIRRSDALSLQLRTAAAANDYDAKFSDIIQALSVLPKNSQSAARSETSRPQETGASLKQRLLILQYRLSPSISRIVDRLPPSLRKLAIRAKRLILN